MARYERRFGPAEAGQGIGLALQSFAQQLQLAQERQRMEAQNRFIMQALPQIGQAQTQEDALAKGMEALGMASKFGVTDPTPLMTAVGSLYKNLPSRKDVELRDQQIASEAAQKAAAEAKKAESIASETATKRETATKVDVTKVDYPTWAALQTDAGFEATPDRFSKIQQSTANWNVLNDFRQTDVARETAAKNLGLDIDINTYRAPETVKAIGGLDAQMEVPPIEMGGTPVVKTYRQLLDESERADSYYASLTRDYNATPEQLDAARKAAMQARVNLANAVPVKQGTSLISPSFNKGVTTEFDPFEGM